MAKLLSLRHDRRLAWPGVACLVVAVFLVWVVPAVAAPRDNVGTIRAVLAAQIASTQQGNALNVCLAASPHKNTPCILREALKLENLNLRLVASIKAAMDGTERACVRTVALAEITDLKAWVHAMALLRANKRHEARQAIVATIPGSNALTKLEKVCFPEAIGSGP
jgi:hypothetical protein